MDDQQKHIEDWLKAAAQQPVPDDTGMEAKQQAWSKMASLLDNAAVPVPAQQPSPLPKPWFATGQGMLWLAAAAAAVGLVALVVYLQVNRHQTTENKELQGVVHENVSTVKVNERNGDTLSTEKKNDSAAGNNEGTAVYGSTESDTMDEGNRGAALNGQGEGGNTAEGINGNAAEGIDGDDTAEGINGDGNRKRPYGLAAGAGRLITQVIPQGNELWSGVTAGTEKRTGEKGRNAAPASGAGEAGATGDEKAAQEELSSTTNIPQPVVRESDTGLSSNNLINKSTAKSALPAGGRSSSEKTNANKTSQPVNQVINGNNEKINNKPGSLPATDKTTDLAINTPGKSTVNTSKHPYIKAGKVKPGSISGEGSAGKTKPGSVIKRTQPSGGVSGGETAGKTKPGGVIKATQPSGGVSGEETAGKAKPGGQRKATQPSGGVPGGETAGKAKPGGQRKATQPSGGVSGEETAGKTKPGGVRKAPQPSSGVSGEETTAGKTKPGSLVKTPQTSYPDNVNKAQSAIIPSQTTPNNTSQQGKTPVTIKNATGTPNAMVLKPLRTVNAFSIHLPALPLNSREQVGFMGGGFRDPVNNSEAIIGGLALQAGFVYPLSVGVAAGDSGTTKPGNGLGFKLSALYSFPIARGLYLQPTLSASYLTGFGKAFSHIAVNRKQETDSSGAASGEYRTDSITTPYTVKSTFVGGAGVNVAYVINKWIFSTGLTYQYALPSGTKGTPETSSHTDSLQSVPTGSTPAFSKQQLPGMHTLSWSLDAGYFIRPRIQVGVSYRAILLRSAGNSGFAKPVQPLQDKQLEFYIRVPLRK
ncbi:hypothetical protein SAMN04488505_1021008 [Chitinophaga rupis]|uniref:Uncharacterized protein n=1 Tax=Chitinophaga rupis TaxID=573321 RepID=A0A1H7SQT1_9BACT|nr:hypothetical protein [Chitinophaga rupis]SEL74853.1 hypothetical protein SAMN04488505_1021008 [Chitinophaga rupis]